MVSPTSIRFFFCFALVLITACKRTLDEKEEPAFKLARTVTGTGPIPLAADADIRAGQALIASDIVPKLLEFSDFSLAFPFALVSREYFNIVCSTCFRKLQTLPISPSIPTSKAILTFASQHLKMSGLRIKPEGAIDTILRLITGTDNQRILMQAVIFLSQLEIPESKKKDVISATTYLQLKFKPAETAQKLSFNYLKIKCDGFSAFSNIVISEILHLIRCTRHVKFCRPKHVNRARNTFFGNIRVFYPEYFEKMLEEIVIMDTLPIVHKDAVKFLPFYQEIMGGLIKTPYLLSIPSIIGKIKADDFDLFWKMTLAQLAALPNGRDIGLLGIVGNDPILDNQYDTIVDYLTMFYAPDGFSVKNLSGPKKQYLLTYFTAKMNLIDDATDDKIEFLATKALEVQDFKTSTFLLVLLRSAGHYNAIFKAIDEAMTPFNPHVCALDVVKNIDGTVLTDYIIDRRQNRKWPILMERLAFNLDQIVKGNLQMAEAYNEFLEYVAGQHLPLVRKMAYIILYTASAAPSLRSDENVSIIVGALSKRGSWVRDLYEESKVKRD